ncbi:SDR family oxidoreductase [Candidatus Marinimicrobia bacterium]|nr:SDR family oxidoreductase [Candidatus Neomarinimicrobiota bacterium]
MKKILITGASGQLGKTLKTLFSSKYDIIPTSKNHYTYQKNYFLDITNPILIRDIVSATSPDIIINLAALTNVDLCEKKPDLAFSVNFTGLQNIVEIFNGPIIQLSTDYVFDGKTGQYSENSSVNPINVYGRTKLEAENFLKENSKDSLIIRTNVLFDYMSESPASFLNWVVKSLEDDKKINVVDDQWNNPTWTNSIAVAIDKAIEFELNGLIHWGDNDYISRFDFAIKIAETFQLKKNLINPIKTAELNQIAARPLKGGLNVDRAKSILNLEPSNISDCLKYIWENINA